MEQFPSVTAGCKCSVTCACGTVFFIEGIYQIVVNCVPANLGKVAEIKKRVTTATQKRKSRKKKATKRKRKL